ncbi:hypothetical protein HAX54_030143 [Datura stramonium]|uniref:Uncharacterized protein n=1 Tax=Datura stramonium TaxID=4076 RepID=A0ABS8V8H5_DATST|nr:hypothetical protein [Datura stramonium]
MRNQKEKMVKLTLMDKSDIDSKSDSSEQMSIEKVKMLKFFSNLKSDYNVLKREKIESKNAIKILNTEINNLEETASVQKTENRKLMETVSSLKAEINTIKEGKTSNNEIIINDQGFHEAEIASLKKELCKEKKKSSKFQVTLNQENYDIALMKWNKSFEALTWLNENHNRAKTGLDYKNKPVKWDRKRKYVDLPENEEELEIGLVPSLTNQVSATAQNEGTLLEIDSLNVPSEPRQELKNSGGTIPEIVVSSKEGTGEGTSSDPVPETQNDNPQELILRP